MGFCDPWRLRFAFAFWCFIHFANKKTPFRVSSNTRLAALLSAIKSYSFSTLKSTSISIRSASIASIGIS